MATQLANQQHFQLWYMDTMIRGAIVAMVHPQVAMVAWGQPPLVSSTENHYNKMTIPIQATCLGVLNFFFQICLTSANSFSILKFARHYFQYHVILYLAMHMPRVLLLTVKSNEPSKKSPQHASAPIGLQFHD